MWYSFKRWVRHLKFNPIPCTCYACEIKKPLPQWAIDEFNRKYAAGEIPVRKLPKRRGNDERNLPD